MSRRRAACPRGASLVELLAILPAVGIIAAAIGGALVVVTRSASMPPGERGDAFAAARAANRFAADLAEALTLSQLTATVAEFQVPDRTGNGRPDVLRYSWTGSVGDPLLLRLNQQPAEPVLDDVQVFDLAPLLSTNAPDPLDEELAVIASHDHAPESHTHDRSIEPSKWCAQYFAPVLPNGTTKWSIKRVRFKAKRDGDDLGGVLGVRIETTTLSQQPSGVVLEKATIKETALDEMAAWVDVDFTSLNDLDPVDGFCLVITQDSGTGHAAKVPYEHGGNPMTAGTFWMTTDNAGSSWTASVNDKDMPFYVLGTYDTWVPTARQYVDGVRIRVRRGPTASAEVERTATITNAVEYAP